MMRYGLWVLILVMLGACAPTDTSSPTDDDTGSAVDLGAVATPTREGDDGLNIIGDPGSGFGIGDDALSDEVGFAAVLEGGENAVIRGGGSINCENNVYVIRADMSSFPQVSLILPADAGSGIYELVDNTGDGRVASATVFLEDGRTYAVVVDGVLVIDVMATAPEQQIAGSFDFTASNGSDTVTARGEFNFVSGADAIYCG